MDLTKLNAYEAISSEPLPDIHSRGYLLRHKKTGAHIMLMENDDDNKVFTIAFRTPPENSTGVAHILEHSVLCGSREFPLKDPFVELVKGSLSTFLNAMTFPDKTCYPVASCNDQDFQNLMHVYLDAVFYPNVYQREEIFRQEGWHYHLEDESGPLTYNGVVYNEMRGAFSSPDDVLGREIMNHLFPDTPYGVESGGDPEHIPELSYEEFLSFHRHLYHPSNSYIFLYGNMDMAEKLDFIDSHYLSAFDRIEVDSVIPLQKGFDRIKDVVKEYPISESEDPQENTFLSYNLVIGDYSDLHLCVAFEVLDYALLSAPGAPLRKALVEAGIGTDVYGSYEDGILQPYFSIVAKGARADQKDEFMRIIHEVLHDLQTNGIDKKSLLAGLNYNEFRYREADYATYPKGLMYGLDTLGDWIYSDENDPFAQVKLIQAYQDLRTKIDTDFFEQLLKTWLIDNTHGVILTLLPVPGLAAQKDAELAQKLEDYRKSLTEDELRALTEQTKALAAYQEEEDSPEAIAKLPMLRREDIRRESRKYYTEELDVDGTKLLFHEVQSNGIGYVHLMFDVNGLSVEKAHDIGLLKKILGLIDTEHYSYGELFNEINVKTGGLSSFTEQFEVQDQKGFLVKLGFEGKALYDTVPFLFDMMKEMILYTKFGDTKRIKEIIAEAKSRMQASFFSAGHAVAVDRARSYGSQVSLWGDEANGIGQYRFLDSLDKDFDNKKEELVRRLGELAREIFCREGMMLDYTGEKESLEMVKNELIRLREVLPCQKAAGTEDCLVPVRKNEGFEIAGQVQYVAQVGNFKKHGFSFVGALDILKVIMGYEYLWMNLRVKGGAYGCMSGFLRNGDAYFVSYRDPHLRRTLEIYQGIPDYLEQFTADEREMTQYIIGTISNKDVPLTPRLEGTNARVFYLCGVTNETIQKHRDEILDATDADIRALAPLVKAVLEENLICVVGSESAVAESEDLFMEVKPLL